VGLADVQHLGIRDFSACASDGDTVRCWGEGTGGDLGDGQMTNRSLPVTASWPAGVLVAALGGGSEHHFGLGTKGEVLCWGSNDWRQCALERGTGDGCPTNSNCFSTPRDITGAIQPSARITAVGAGWRHTCALDETGAVYCFGANTSKQVAPPPGSLLGPVQVLSGATQIGIGQQHGCALVTGGGKQQVVCWGSNEYGQIDTGDPSQQIASPRAIAFPR
jgi:alpha-tubulin suppressor-like RCC1 family protein